MQTIALLMRATATSTREKEAHALKRLFEDRSDLSQARFGKEHGLGTAGMVWQYLNAHRPINLHAAMKFAKGLGVRIQDFSPRLAAQARAAALGAGETGLLAREPDPRPYAAAQAEARLQQGAVLVQLLGRASREERQRILDELRILAVRNRERLSPEELALCLDVLDRLESARAGKPRRKPRTPATK
jgi:hypothetical protein